MSETKTIEAWLEDPKFQLRPYSQEDREQFIKDNAVAMVTGLEAKIARYKKIVKRLEQSRVNLRQLLEKQKCRGCGCTKADNFWCDDCAAE